MKPVVAIVAQVEVGVSEMVSQVKTCLFQAATLHRKTLDEYRRCGELLMALKKKVYAINGKKRGWGRWLDSQGLPTEATVNKYMTLAEHWELFSQEDEPTVNLSLNAAMKVIDDHKLDNPEPPEEPEDQDKTQDKTQDNTQDKTEETNPPTVPIPLPKPKKGNGGSKMADLAPYKPRKDGDTWGLKRQDLPDGLVVLLPLQIDSKPITTYLELTKEDAMAFAKLTLTKEDAMAFAKLTLTKEDAMAFAKLTLTLEQAQALVKLLS